MRLQPRHARPVSLFVLTVVLLVEGVAALYGGIPMLLDPHGEPLGMPPALLAGSPFGSYLVPGLLLTFVLGVYPLLAVLLLWWRPEWKAMARLERATRRHWTWSVGVTAGIAMLVWIVVQVLMLGANHPLQAIVAGLGLLVVLVAFLPDVRRAYRPSVEPAPHLAPAASRRGARRR
ncbi:MAG: hypothetical protein P8Y02_07910 [Deinococcales bacterium]